MRDVSRAVGGGGMAIAAWVCMAGAAFAQPEGEDPSGTPDETPPEGSPSLDAERVQEAVATELFNEGRALLESGDFDAACAKLVESAKLAPKVGTLGKLASCEERRGRLVAARAVWTQAEELARRTGDDRLSVVGQELARLNGAIPKLQVKLPPNAPPATRVRLDGIELATATIATPVDPGEHTVTVEAPGKQPRETKIRAEANGATTVVEVPPLADDAEPSPPRPPVAPLDAPPGGAGPWPVVAVATVGVGAAAIAVGAFYGGLALGRVDEAENRGCNAEPCSPEGAQVLEDARTAGDTSTAFVIAGSVLVAGGIALWIFGPDDEPAATRVGAVASAGPDAAGLWLKGEF